MAAAALARLWCSSPEIFFAACDNSPAITRFLKLDANPRPRGSGTSMAIRKQSLLLHCKKNSGNLRDQILSYVFLMISTFKLLTNRSFSFQLFWIYQVPSYNLTCRFPELQVPSYIVGLISWKGDKSLWSTPTLRLGVGRSWPQGFVTFPGDKSYNVGGNL